jgi:hypothetical protein
MVTGGPFAAMDLRHKSELLENANGVPGAMNYMPLQPVSGRDGVGVMVVYATHLRNPAVPPTNCWWRYRGCQSGATSKYARRRSSNLRTVVAVFAREILFRDLQKNLRGSSRRLGQRARLALARRERKCHK